MEDPAVAADAAPRSGVVAGLDLSGYTTTPAIATPTVDGQDRSRGRADRMEGPESRERDVRGHGARADAPAATRAIHPMGEMTFNPVARRGDPDWRVMYIGSGDAGTGEQRDSRRLNPQRLDTLVGKILRIVPDLREHTATSTVSENGRYRIPRDNPFTALEGARKEIWAYGLRNPHRLIWDVDPARPSAPVLFAFNIGLAAWETVVIVRKGANYGYSLREGTQMMSSDGMGAIPQDDTIPIQISDTVVRGTVKPTYPVIQYPHMAENGGDAIAGGFVYRGSRSRRSEASSCSATSRRAGSGTPSLPTCSRPTMATRRRWRRFTRSTQASAASWKKPIARAAAGARHCPARPPSRAAAAWTSGSRSTTMASSTSSRRATG